MEIKEFKKLNKIYIKSEDVKSLFCSMYFLPIANVISENNKIEKLCLPRECGLMPTFKEIKDYEEKNSSKAGLFRKKSLNPSAIYGANLIKKGYRIIRK